MIQSSRSRRALKQLGSGSSANLFSFLPVPARSLPAAPTLTREAKKRLAWFTYAQTYSVSQTCRHFGIARSLFYYWKSRYNPHDLSQIECRSSRPRRVRQRQWTAAQVAAVRQAHEEYPRWGKAKLAIVLARRGSQLCVSTIGRILTDLKRRGLLVTPRRVRATPQARHPRPHAQRKPKGVTLPRDAPGDLVEFDTMQLSPAPGVVRYQFTATDVVSRWSVVGVRARATAGTAKEFLSDAQARMPFAIKAIQIDGGGEFMAAFEQACQDDRLPLWVLPPRSPKLNGHVERSNRTHREEFWECYDGDLDLPVVQPALRGWEEVYNTERPHHALGLRTPAQFLADWQAAQLSNRS
jgi:putative transposase